MSAFDGLRVLDLTRLLPGGYCTLLLADHGADVIKVEDTGAGDYARADPPAFASLNRGKRSIQLDLKTEGGRDGAAAAGARRRRADRVLPAGRDGPARRRLRGAARDQPAARVLRDHRLRAGRAAARAGRARPQLPGENGRARVERRGGRAAGAGRGADRRRRRRRADGGVRDPGRAALRRGPVRRHLDGRRRAVAAGHARRGAARGRRAAAARRADPRRAAALLPAVRVRRRPRLDGRAGAEVLGRVLQRRRTRRT